MKVLFIACVAALIACAVASSLSDHEAEFLFNQWAAKHSKEYKSLSERAYRQRVFRKNMDFIVSENAKGNSYSLAMNEFGDMTNVEFRAKFTAPLKNTPNMFANAAGLHKYNGEALPTSVDWVAAGKVNPVKNQQQCGSCWAFSATCAIESAWAIAKNQLVSLSEQQLVDCSAKYGNSGCEGGLMSQAFEYVIANGGQDKESTYPYRATDGSCKFKSANIGAKITSYVNVTANSNADMMSAVAKGPVSIAIYAAGTSFQFYSEGVYSDPSCLEDISDLDHGVVVVGYGLSDNNKPYWKVRNSWGQSWGQSGYIYMARGTGASDSNTCGLLDIPSYPVV
eukprot:ANDGO_00931.mRNA.1 Digestive cysteine proteinase 3